MKRKGIKSFISIGLASAMLLTACGGSAATSGSNETVPKEESAAEQTTAAAQSGETAKADSSDIVKLRFSMMKHGGLILYGKAEFLKKSVKTQV